MAEIDFPRGAGALTGRPDHQFMDGAYGDPEVIAGDATDQTPPTDANSGPVLAKAALLTSRLAHDMLSGAYKVPHKAFDHPDFITVGLACHPEKVRYAQGVQMAAQIFHDICHDMAKEYPTHFKPDEIKEYAEGFKAAASGIYRMAADQMRKDGDVRSADEAMATADFLATGVKAGRTPSDAMRFLSCVIWGEERNRNEETPGYLVGSSPLGEKIDWLSELTVAPGSSREATIGKRPDTSLSPKQ